MKQDRNSPQFRSLPSSRGRIRTLVPRRFRCNITIPGTLSIPPHRLQTSQIQFIKDVPEERNDSEVALCLEVGIV
jgi:hypothetical protein